MLAPVEATEVVAAAVGWTSSEDATLAPVDAGVVDAVG